MPKHEQHAREDEEVEDDGSATDTVASSVEDEERGEKRSVRKSRKGSSAFLDRQCCCCRCKHALLVVGIILAGLAAFLYVSYPRPIIVEVESVKPGWYSGPNVSMSGSPSDVQVSIFPPSIAITANLTVILRLTNENFISLNADRVYAKVHK